MNVSLAITLPLIAAASLLASNVSSAETASCTPRLVEKHTKFPIRSQLRGHEGTVYMAVTVDANGRPLQADLAQSSGHRLLDRAATASVLDNWQFDVSACERKDLPSKYLYAVEYRNDPY